MADRASRDDRDVTQILERGPVNANLDLPMLSEATLPSLLLRRADSSQNTVALRVKERGVYREVCWGEYCREVERIAAALTARGFGPGDRLAILSDPCPQWLYCEMGSLAAGGVCYGIYPTSSSDQVAEVLRHGGAKVVVVEDQEQLDKLIACGDALAEITLIVIIDTRGIFGYDDPRLISYRDLVSSADAKLVPLRELTARLDPSQPALMIFTSGTSGEPKAAVYTHAGIIRGAEDYRVCLLGGRAGSWRTVCHLPLNHAFEQWNTVLLPLMAPVVPHFGEEAARFADTLFDVAPDYYASVPRHWQKLASRVLVSMQNSSREKQLAFQAAMAIGRRYLRARWAGRPSWMLSAAYRLAWLLVFRPVLDKLGLKRVRVAITAGGPIPIEVQTLWQIWGVNLKNLYGQTEAGFISVQQRAFPEPGDAGTPAPSVTLRLAEDGEILVLSKARCSGYLGHSPLGADEWFATGDTGTIDEGGVLRIVDRKKDIFITAGGKNVAPLAIENLLRTSPFISEAIVIGDGRRYLTALLEIDYDTVSQWARTEQLTYGSFEDLATHPRVGALIDGELAKVNNQLSRVEQVKVARIIPRELDPEAAGEPVTPTRKVKRQLMYERFRDLVESMYQDAESELIVKETVSGRAR